jgi:hypothetical protein
MTAQERLTELLTVEWSPTNRTIVFADIATVVGLEPTALVVGTMKAASATNPLMDTIIIAMSTNGLSLSTPERQGVIDMLAATGQWPESLRDAVKALGGSMLPKWQILGYESEPTLESIQEEIDATEMAEQQTQLRQMYRDVHSQVIVPVVDGSDLSIESLATAFRDAANRLEASWQDQ